MTKFLFPRLAADGIRKNRRLYLPYLFTCVMTAAMFYILYSLAVSPQVEKIRGHTILGTVLRLGSFVIAVFAVLFLFYTNSFLIRRRKKEFGLYNILGMGKWSIARILFWETVMTYLMTGVFGLGFGIALSKLAELGLTNMIGAEISLDFFVSWDAAKYTLLLFGVIDLLIFLNGLRQIQLAKPVELLRSENVGEKPPRGNWLLALLGIVILGGAYYLAVSIQNPLEAMTWFFVAVVMVIVATYLLLISGSVLLCRLLQKNRRYYYRAEHFVSTSSMTYRMKRNGAGLASICVLLTMVLVMISSAGCLYFGEEDSLNSRYPRDLSIRVDYYRESGDEALDMEQVDGDIARIRAELETITHRHGANPKNLWDTRELYAYGLIHDGRFEPDPDSLSSFDSSTYSELCSLRLIPVEDYNRKNGTDLKLGQGEAAVFGSRIKYSGQTLRLGSLEYRIVERLEKLEIPGDAMADILPTVILIVPDLEPPMLEGCEIAKQTGMSEALFRLSWTYGFDTDLSYDAQMALLGEALDWIRDCSIEGSTFYSYGWDCRADAAEDFYATYGGLFFIGIVLSILFLVACVLIIYYKQVSEGYEDQSRFEIMQKVGMTKRMIRRSINSQMRTVFLLPIGMAVLHLGFAFPMISRLLRLFALDNVSLFLLTAAGSVLVFGALYALVYRLTSNTYFSIVSGGRDE